MTHDAPLSLTPEQSDALSASHGMVYLQDPATKRCFFLVEQVPQERLTADELRAMLDEAIAESDRGEALPWNPEEIKETLRNRHENRSAE